MSRFRNKGTGVVVSVADAKDGRFTDGWESADAEPPKKAPAKKAAPKPEK